MRSKLQKETIYLMQSIRMSRMKFQGMQRLEDFEDWDIGETRDISDCISTLKYKDENVFKFDLVIPIGQGFPSHTHNVVERIDVIFGKMKDSLVHGEWTSGSVRFIDSYSPHAPYNSGDKNLHVLVTFDRRIKTMKDVQTKKV